MPAPILDDISHRRYNPLRGSWVLVSPHRTKRPWQGAQEEASKTTLPQYDPSCYLCPGNQRAQGDQNPEYESTFVFVNDYSAVKEEQAEYKEEDQNGSLSSRLLRAESVTGKCYVITFAPSHNLTLADLTPAQILPVIQTWTQIYTAHLSPNSPLAKVAPPTTLPPTGHENHSIATPNAQYRYMQIFENKGAAMGCSNPHPHGQVWTTTGLPEEPGLELEQLKKYRREQGGVNLLEDYAKLESEKQERVVFENSAFLAVCPWWATWPFEVMIVARQHKRALVDFSDQDRSDLAEAIAEVTRRYDNLFETQFPYSMGLHQAPLEGTDAEIEASHFHIHFYPPLLRSATVRKFLVGYEMMAEPQRDITPEQAAARLRDCGGVLYRKRISGEADANGKTDVNGKMVLEDLNGKADLDWKIDAHGINGKTGLDEKMEREETEREKTERENTGTEKPTALDEKTEREKTEPEKLPGLDEKTEPEMMTVFDEKAEPERAELERTELEKTEPQKTVPEKMEPGKTELEKTELEKTVPEKMELGNTELEKTELVKMTGLDKTAQPEKKTGLDGEELMV